MPQLGRKARRNRNGWPGRGFLRWDSGMVGKGCRTVPASQDPSLLQTAGDETQGEPHGIGISPIHPARRFHSGQSHLAPASLPERISPSHRLLGWGSTGIRALLTRQGSICNRVRPHCSTAAGGSWRLPGIWVRLARHRDLAVGRGWGSRGCGD